jgi:peptide subunit release factor 1 (eRF1)
MHPQVAELAVQFFITNDKPNVAGLILAGSADFKTELSQSDMFDPRLQAVVLGVVDVSYGGDNGFSQAIELSADMLANVKFVQVGLDGRGRGCCQALCRHSSSPQPHHVHCCLEAT